MQKKVIWYGMKVYLNCPPLSDFCFWKGRLIPIIPLIVFLLRIGGVVLVVVVVVDVFLSGINGGLTVVGPVLALLVFPKLLIVCGQDRGCLSSVGDLNWSSASLSSSFFDLVLD